MTDIRNSQGGCEQMLPLILSISTQTLKCQTIKLCLNHSTRPFKISYIWIINLRGCNMFISTLAKQHDLTLLLLCSLTTSKLRTQTTFISHTSYSQLALKRPENGFQIHVSSAEESPFSLLFLCTVICVKGKVNKVKKTNQVKHFSSHIPQHC